MYVLPDPGCTPGAVNPSASQADIRSTICLSGWTATVRPPESYTEPLKAAQITAYGDAGPISGYEEDHLVPLELGGSPTAVGNLWPEPGASPNPKDAVENAGKRAVCDGSMTLTAAQQAIASDWITFGERLGVTSVPPSQTAATVARAAPTPASTVAIANYRAGEFCPKADIGETVTTSEGPLTCKVTTSPDHPHWEHA